MGPHAGGRVAVSGHSDERILSAQDGKGLIPSRRAAVPADGHPLVRRPFLYGILLRMDMRIFPVSPPRSREWGKNTALQGMCIILRNFFFAAKGNAVGSIVCYRGMRLPSVSALRNPLRYGPLPCGRGKGPPHTRKTVVRSLRDTRPDGLSFPARGVLSPP